MTEQERADAIYSMQRLARDRERLLKAWDDVVIAVLELEFLEPTD